MMGFARSDDYQPLFWVRGRPINVTTLIVALHVISLTVCCLLRGFGNLDVLPLLMFSSGAVLHHAAIWQVVTYAFAHTPSLWFLVDMAMLFIFGREVERYFGRKVFAGLYTGLVLTAPVVLLTMELVRGGDDPEGVGLFGLDGGQLVHFGVFIAFVTIYPDVQFFFGIAAVWIAAALLAISTLMMANAHLFPALLVLWADTGVAWLATRYVSIGSDAFALFGNLRQHFPRKTTPRGVRPRLKPRRGPETGGYVDQSGGGRPGDVHESIDPLLDKISKHGIASLTNSERATLERARVSLLRKERET